MDKLRRDIDLIDVEIMDLLNKRFDLVKEVKKYKKENNIAIMDLKREEEVLNKSKKYTNHYYIEEVYRKVLKLSKELQK